METRLSSNRKEMRKMKWSNAPPIILEKVIQLALINEQLDRKIDDYYDGSSFYSNKRLLIIDKFCRVSAHWKEVIFSSKLFIQRENVYRL